jgi:hypothetical protein
MVWHGNIWTVEFSLQQNENKEAWDTFGRRPKDLAKGHPCTIIELLLQNGSDIRVSDAIRLEERLLEKKEQKEAKTRKTKELAAARAERRMACLMKEAGKLVKEQLGGEEEQREEQSD